MCHNLRYLKKTHCHLVLQDLAAIKKIQARNGNLFLGLNVVKRICNSLLGEICFEGSHVEPGFVETFAATIVELRNSIDMNSTSDTSFLRQGMSEPLAFQRPQSEPPGVLGGRGQYSSRYSLS